MSLDAVAKVTKIQPRILERLEAGKLDGLPAEVFVRGFVRSFARCVGLDEGEALRRYAACGLAAGTGDLTPTVRALVEAMVDLAPGAVAPRATPRRMQAVQPVEIIDLGGPGMPATAEPGVPASPEPGASASLLVRGGPGAVVETMMLPETGTVVLPAQLFATPVCEPEAPAVLPAGSFDALPVADARLTQVPLAAPSDAPASAAVVELASAAVVEAASATVVEAASATVVEAGSATVVEAGSATVVEAASAAALEAASVVAVEPVMAVEPAIATAVEPAAAASEPGKKKRGRRGGKGRNKRAGDAGISRELLATGTPPSASPVVAPIETAVHAELVPAGESPAPASLETSPTSFESSPASFESSPTSFEASPTSFEASPASFETPPASTGATASSFEEPIATETWAPRMPPAAPSVPWRKPAYAAAPAPIVPSLVIDDADPDSAERVLEERAEAVTPRRSFLPPILLDREDRSARQGGLTLAVIILLIAATLTLSYLMRRPSAAGDGMTRRETPASYVV